MAICDIVPISYFLTYGHVVQGRQSARAGQEIQCWVDSLMTRDFRSSNYRDRAGKSERFT